MNDYPNIIDAVVDQMMYLPGHNTEDKLGAGWHESWQNSLNFQPYLKTMEVEILLSSNSICWRQDFILASLTEINLLLHAFNMTG